jgi:hypothetical protein
MRRPAGAGEHLRTRREAKIGAGSENRTRIFSLEGCCSTIELYPRPVGRKPPQNPVLSRKVSRKRPVKTRPARAQSARRLVEGVGFEPTYAKRPDLQSGGFNHSPTPPKPSLAVRRANIANFEVSPAANGAVYAHPARLSQPQSPPASRPPPPERACMALPLLYDLWSRWPHGPFTPKTGPPDEQK